MSFKTQLYCCTLYSVQCTAAKFIVLTGGDKVDSGIGLSYWPARLYRLAGQLYPPFRDYEFGYCKKISSEPSISEAQSYSTFIATTTGFYSIH